jgi:hypothetical protein
MEVYQASYILCFTYYTTMDRDKNNILWNTTLHNPNSSSNSTFITVKTKYEFLGAFAKLQKEKGLSSLSCLYVRPFTWNNLDPTGQIFVKIYITMFFENLSRKFKFHWNKINITLTTHEDRYTFLITFRSVPLKMRNVSNKSFWET